MKRILIFSLAYYPHVGGAEVALKELTDRLGSDFEFHMLTMNFGGAPAEERAGAVIVHRLGSGGSYLSKVLFILRAASAARRMHGALHFDAFWAMMSYMLFPIALLRLSGTRVPYVLTLQEGDPFSRVFGRWFILPLRPLLSYGFRHAAAITAISTYLARWAQRFGYNGAVTLVPNGVETARFANAAATERGEGLELVTASRLVPKNALDDVIRALVLLPPRVHFRIYGIGPEERRLRALAKELGVEDRVMFSGFVSHTELPSALKRGDIFVRPSRSEGMGNAFIEAMAAGLPVVATQAGGIADFLFDAKRNLDKPPTGFAVDPESPEQIASAVKEIMTDPRKVEQVRENAFRLVREQYDWDLIAEGMKRVLDTVV